MVTVTRHGVFVPYHLIGQQQDGLEAELSGAEVKEVLQAGTQQLHHHHVVVSLGAAPLYRRDAHWRQSTVVQ